MLPFNRALRTPQVSPALEVVPEGWVWGVQPQTSGQLLGASLSPLQNEAESLPPSCGEATAGPGLGSKSPHPHPFPFQVSYESLQNSTRIHIPLPMPFAPRLYLTQIIHIL